MQYSSVVVTYSSGHLFVNEINIIITVFHSSGIFPLSQMFCNKIEMHSVNHHPTFLKSFLEYHLPLGIKAMLWAESTFFSGFIIKFLHF